MSSSARSSDGDGIALPTSTAPPPPPVDLGRVRAVLRGLDASQRRAVTHPDGPLLVLAGPGTGKTEVITRRIAWLIATRRARPSEILALTFTERAADEMLTRVDELVAYGQVDTTISTFHAFGDRLIREHGFSVGLPDDPRVVGRAESALLLRERLFELGLRRYLPLGDPTRFVTALVELFAKAKSEGVSADEYLAYARELAAGARVVLEGAEDEEMRAIGAALIDEAEGQAELAAAYARYEALLRDGGLVDHGDQVLLAVGLLDRRPAVRAAVRARYRYILVDEAQDSDRVQARLVELLAGPAGNVTFVGDDDQAVYGFRGAAIETMLGLSTTYAGLRRVVLRYNHRSRPPILEAARRLVRLNDPHRLEVREGVDKSLRAARRVRVSRPVRAHAFATTADEADHVASEVVGRLARGMPPSSCAVLVRSRTDAEPILRSLRVRGVPVRFSGTSGLTSHADVRDVLSLLRTLASPSSSTDLYAVASAAPYGLGGMDMTSLLERASRRRRTLWETCTEVVEQPGTLRLSPAGRATLERLVTDLTASLELAHERPAGEVLYAHLRRSGWLARLVAAADRGDDEPLRRVARVFEIVAEQGTLLADGRVAVLVPHLQALMDAGETPALRDRDESEQAVAVLTIHQAKGLEFPVVHVVGLADGRFPVKGAREGLPFPATLGQRGPEQPGDAVAEERRLMYVAMTRARDELILSYAERAAVGGRRRRPSPFLAEALGWVPALEPAAVPAKTASLVPAAPTPLVSPRLDGSSASRGSLDLSFSQVDDYLTCPLRYRLRHDLRVPTPPHHALVTGSALHQAIAAHLVGRLRGRPLAEDGVLEVFAAHWRSEGFLSRQHEDARYEAGRLALRHFIAAGTFVGQRTILAVERPFTFRLGPDTIRGRYDLVSRDSEGVVITDHKSSDVRDPRRARERARDSLQLQLYALAHEAETGELPAALELHFVDSGLVGRVAPEASRLERARERVGEAAEGIRARRFEPRPGYPGCSYCPYRDICPAAA